MPFAPFIVTAELPPDVLSWADRLRRAHFPPERNHLAAHVTLFHALAPSLRGELKPLLVEIAATTAPPSARLTGLMNLGRGTALVIECPAMLALRQSLADRFHGALTAQDQHVPRLHISIQNKVTAEAARALRTELAQTPLARDFRFAGLGLHLYRGPHWEAAGRLSFRGHQGG